MSGPVDRQATFGGTEPPPAHLVLNCGALETWLAPRLVGLGTIESIVKFKGGQSNPTYLITATGGRYVLRRKPPGVLIKSAHAIDREFRVMAAMEKAGVPVPHGHLYCDDGSVIGSEFYIADHCAGRVFWNAEVPGIAPAERAAIYDGMNAAFARLHDLDPVAVGLGDIGPVGGYAGRNLSRWSGIYRASALIEIPDMAWLIDALADRVPPTAPTTLIHGDYGLYNIIVDAERPEIVAILDWEMATLGDPFVDLAHHLRAWWDIPDPGGSATSLRGLDLAALGIPAMESYVALYCERRDVAAPDMGFYLAYAQFRYAAMIQGILKRAADGTASSRIMLHRQDRVIEIAAMARATLTA